MTLLIYTMGIHGIYWGYKSNRDVEHDITDIILISNWDNDVMGIQHQNSPSLSLDHWR